MKCRLLTLTIGSLLGFWTAVHGANIQFDNGGSDWLWSTSANWQNDTLPGAGDEVRMNTLPGGGTITVNSAAAAGRVNLYNTDTAALDVVIGGNLTVATNILLGAANTTGALYVNGGTLSSSSFLRIGTGTGGHGAMEVNAGTVTVGGQMTVGYNTTGSFDMSGGTVNVATFLRLGELAGGSGTATISDGSLSIGTITTIGMLGHGSLTVSGGSVSMATLQINHTNNAAINAQVALLGGSLEITGTEAFRLAIGGDDTLHIEGGDLLWAGDHLADIGTLVAGGQITWENGQAMLGAYDISWTNGTSVLYADYDDLNSGKTTVWATAIPEPATIGLFLISGAGLLGLRRRLR
jgi:hypothetical protein